ncbi:MAG: NAD-dependent epimerase/dehydratase family protein [Lachnospiraceae bacterium]|nr:NAD-dependent epimerase/dehydratase family protein [Lachnospiraceae bacterium]MBD5511148.1 NAD-dependent epimerase/dehydratase family protein [Lachnospiraceae bacterium]
MRDKILILGAAGFIGTNLTLRLCREQKKLVLFEQKGAQYQEIVLGSAKAGNIEFAEGAFTEYKSGDWLEQLPCLKEIDTVYHLISTTCPTNSNRNMAVEMEENLIATIRFLDACVSAGIPKVVFLSSGGTVYGKKHTGLCREEEEAFPITVYGMQKLSIEKALYLYRQMYGMDYRIIRLANPYGPYQKPNGIQGAVTTFTWRAIHKEPIQVYGDGSVVRDYIYIDDAIDGIVRIAECQGKHRLYNLGSGRGHSIKEVIEMIAEVLGELPKVRYQAGRPVDVPVNVLDISRFEQDFGKLKAIELKEGICRLVEFYQSL